MRNRRCWCGLILGQHGRLAGWNDTDQRAACADELTHYKRKNDFVKWTTAIVVCCLLVVLVLTAACGQNVTPTTASASGTTAVVPPATATRASSAGTAQATATRASGTVAATPGTPGGTRTASASVAGSPAATRTTTAVSAMLPTLPPLPTLPVGPTGPVPTPVGPVVTVTGPMVGDSPAVGQALPGAAGIRPRRQVTAANPLRVYVAGDSFAEWLGADINTYGQQSGAMTTSTDGKISSGLLSPNFFDWPARFRQTLPALKPDVVVLILGANDLHGLSTSAGYFEPGSAGWQEEYGRRQGEMMDLVGQAGAELYWLAEPPMRDPAQNAAARAVNAAAQVQIAQRPWVHYVDSWKLFSDKNGNYTSFGVDQSGQTTILRQDDGLHLSREGTTWLAALAYGQMRRDWQLP